MQKLSEKICRFWKKLQSFLRFDICSKKEILLFLSLIPLVNAALVADDDINIIPTPKNIIRHGEDMLVKSADKDAVIVISDNPSEEEMTIADCLNREINEDYHFKLPVLKISELPTGQINKFIIIFGWGAFFPASKLFPEVTKKITDNLKKSKNSQFYTLLSGKENGIEYVAFSGKNSKSSIYGATSFVQMLKRSDNLYNCPSVEITDYPDFKHRWAMGLNCESAMKYKINVGQYFSIYENFKPEINRYLEANRYGKKVGILPLCGVFGDLNLKNRESYPDGRMYPCIGEGGNSVQDEGYYTTYSNDSSLKGFCMSNPELLKLKCENIKRFVENNEPLCIFIHYHDRDTYERAMAEWKNRCPKCKEKYPDDRLETETGKAKGMADELNSILENIYSVKKDNGYDAAKDCLVIFVLAPYTRWSESDEDFTKEMLYYANVSKNLKYVDNVNFALREQFFGEDGKSRIKALSEALKKNGKGHELFLYCHGGDTRTAFRKWPLLHPIRSNWLATPVLTCLFEGVENCFVQTHSNIALEAECLWNTKSPSIDYQILSSQKDIISIWRNLSSGYLPEEIFSKGKFFDKVYQNRYGLKAGSILADALRPEYFNKDVIIYPETTSLDFLKYIDSAWGLCDSIELQKKWKTLFEQIKVKNTALSEAIEEALQCDDFKNGRKAELMQIKKSSEINLVWLSFCMEEADFYIACNDHVPKVKQLYDTLLKKVKTIPDAANNIVKEKEERLKSALNYAMRPKEVREAYSREAAMAICEEAKKELAPRGKYNLEEKKKTLKIFRIGIVDDGKQYLRERLKELGIRHMEFLKTLNDDIMQYDIVIYMGKFKLRGDQYDIVRNFVSSGKGLLILSAAPYFMCGSGDLLNISEWFGASDYGNMQGNVKALSVSFITEGMENWISEFSAKKGNSVIMSFTTGYPLLVSKENPSQVYMFANKYKKGRVFYSSIVNIPDDMILKIFLWLGYNYI